MEQQLKDAFNKNLKRNDKLGMSIIATRARIAGFSLEFEAEEKEEKKENVIKKHKRKDKHENLFI